MIKSFIGMTVGAVVGGEAIRQTGTALSGFPGIRNVTQIGIGLGIMGHSAGKFLRMK